MTGVQTCALPIYFACNLRTGGRLIVCADDPGGLRLARAAVVKGVPVTTYGTVDAGLGAERRLIDDAHVRVEIIAVN